MWIITHAYKPPTIDVGKRNTNTLPDPSWFHWTLRQTAISNMAGQEDPVQREIHQDWANREYIEVITSSIKKIADFLNSFGKHLTSNLSDKIAT